MRPVDNAMPLNFNKACEIEDFQDAELFSIIREVCAHKITPLGSGFPAGTEYNKDWEVGMAVRTLRHFGALQPNSMILGIAAGIEDTIFYLTRHAKLVFATDRYFNAAEWAPLAPSSMLLDPAREAPFDFDPQRLVVQHMDGRLLRFPDDTFDGIFSSGSMEHFGELEDVAASAYEMGRVLKPGGVLSVSTVLRVGGPARGNGFEGTLVLSPDQIQQYIIEASGLEPVDQLDVGVSEASYASVRDLAKIIEEKRAVVASRNAEGGVPDYALWEFPHLLLEHNGYLFDSVHLALQKTARYPAANNAWAMPGVQIRDSIGRHNDSLLTFHEGRIHPPVASKSPEGPEIHTIDEDLKDFRSSQGQAANQRSGVAQPVDQPAGKNKVIPIAFSPEINYEIEVDREMRDPITVAYLSGGGDNLDGTLLNVMLGHVRHGDVMLDLGAFIGTFSLTAAAVGCRVLSVEASPHNAALLTSSAVRNGFHELRVVNAAVMDEPGEVEFCPAGPWGHVATQESGLASIKVFAVRVDDLLERLGWEEVAFVKLDVEGSEIRAIRGMGKLLNRPNPPAVLFESNAHTLRFYGSGTPELLGEWARFGYTCYLVDEKRLIRTSPDELQPQTVANYLAYKQGVPSMEGWALELQMSTEEKIARLVAETQMVQQDHRSSAGISLETAGSQILSSPEIISALDALAEDESPVVRSSVEWWRKRSVFDEPLTGL